MEKNKNSREKLNEQQSEKISGGFIRNREDGIFIDKESGNKYKSYCDFCGREIEGRGAFLVPGRRTACIYCYEKLNKMNPNDFKADLSDLSNNEFA